MIYGVKRTAGQIPPLRENGWVAFEDHRGQPQWVMVSDVPTPTTNLAVAQAALAMCLPEWRAEIVLLQISWRKP